MPGIGLAISPVFGGAMGTALGQGVGGNLAQLFANGEDGFLLYPMSDLTRLFLLSTGSTGNVAADGDLSGLDLDNHSWGNSVSLSAVMAVQAELLVAGSWAMSVAGGASLATESPAGTLNLTADGANNARGDQSFTTVVGKTYFLTALAGGDGGKSINGNVGTVFGGSQIGVTPSTPSGSVLSFYFVATSTTTWVRFSRTTAGFVTASQISCKLVPGNHALQATGTKRPLWKANSGKPYLAPDGTDDTLVSPFIPTTALTLAVAWRPSASGAKVALGGGISATNKRAYLAVDAAGKAAFGWGSETFAVTGTGSDIRASDHVLLITGDGTSRDLWLDGSLLVSGAPSGGPDGTGGGVSLHAFNNNGSGANFDDGRLHAGLALNRRVPPAEIALITSQFRSAYQ